MLELKNIAFGYTNQLIIKELSLTLESKIYGLLGSNGTGKTTLMKLITLFEKPNEGALFFKGEAVAKNPSAYLSQIGYLPQQTAVFPKMTVIEYLNYFAALKGLPMKMAKAQALELLTLVNLLPSKDAYMSTLSGGMLRRVGLCNALLGNPAILILDEPMTGLDIDEKQNMLSLIHAVSQNRMVLISSHITSELEAICTHIIMYKNGEVLAAEAIGKIMGQFKGSVWEMDCEKCLEMNPQIAVEAKRIIKNGVPRMRVISSMPLTQESVAYQTPTLEDLFGIYQREDYKRYLKGESL